MADGSVHRTVTVECTGPSCSMGVYPPRCPYRITPGHTPAASRSHDLSSTNSTWLAMQGEDLDVLGGAVVAGLARPADDVDGAVDHRDAHSVPGSGQGRQAGPLIGGQVECPDGVQHAAEGL